MAKDTSSNQFLIQKVEICIHDIMLDEISFLVVFLRHTRHVKNGRGHHNRSGEGFWHETMALIDFLAKKIWESTPIMTYI